MGWLLSLSLGLGVFSQGSILQMKSPSLFLNRSASLVVTSHPGPSQLLAEARDGTY